MKVIIKARAFKLIVRVNKTLFKWTSIALIVTLILVSILREVPKLQVFAVVCNLLVVLFIIFSAVVPFSVTINDGTTIEPSTEGPVIRKVDSNAESTVAPQTEPIQPAQSNPTPEAPVPDNPMVSVAPPPQPAQPEGVDDMDDLIF